MTQPLALSAPSHVVRLDELGELIAALPGLLGFPPTDSLVLATFTACDGPRLGPTVRVDLPAPGDRRALVEQLRGALEQNQVVAVTVVIVGGGRADPPELPHRELAELLAEMAAELGTRLVHSAWVPEITRDVTWWCYEERECTGQVYDPDTSTLALIQAVTGTVTYGSRAEMADMLAPDQDDRVAHRAQLLAVLADVPAADPTDLLAELMAVLESDTGRGGLPVLDDEQIARCTAALGYAGVRDVCLALAISERAEPAERLWTLLTRSAPVPERAEPAFLLALCAYLRGAAVLAGMALEVALEADPEHNLAPLLRRALDHGTPPEEVHRLLCTSVERGGRRERRTPG